ncbi:MAG: dethiobiotin synthase [Bdellovibrio sp.]|nr:dethiobiotin synthase [Methylotenera sp.]
MPKALFITGTDTGVGKTYVACKLMEQYAAQGYKVVGMKPIAAGEDFVNGEWVNDDVLKLEAASNVKAPRALTNPYSFKEPIAPHIAAELAGVNVRLEVLRQAFDELSQLADVVIVEGAGGFLVPINGEETLADFAKSIKVPIILVVGMKLGCINHTLLTAEAIKTAKCHLHGWIANSANEKMQYYNENVSTIVKKLQLNNTLLGMHL